MTDPNEEQLLEALQESSAFSDSPYTMFSNITPYPPPTTRVSDSWTTDAIHPQKQCNLFNKLPAEIRSCIWFYALTTDFSDHHGHAFNYRADHDADPRESELQTLLQFDPLRPFNMLPEIDKQSMRDKVTSIFENKQNFREGESEISLANTYDWYRPDCPGLPYTPGLSLLLTCRRIYLEAIPALPHAKLHMFWYYRAPPCRTRLIPTYFDFIIPADVRPHVQDVRMFTQMYVLSSEFLSMCRDEGGIHFTGAFPWEPVGPRSSPLKPYCGPMSQIKRLRITLRRGDWWWNESNMLPIWTPVSKECNDIGRMVQDMERQLGREVVRSPAWNKVAPGLVQYQLEPGDLHDPPPGGFEHDSWALAFRYMPNLETLIFDIEQSEDRRGELACLALWVRRCWWFPAAKLQKEDGTYIKRRYQLVWPPRDMVDPLLVPEGESSTHYSPPPSFEGLDAMWSWRGVATHWGDRCTSPVCMDNEDCGFCERRNLMEELGLGPRMYGYTFVFKLVVVGDDEFDEWS